MDEENIVKETVQEQGALIANSADKSEKVKTTPADIEQNAKKGNPNERGVDDMSNKLTDEAKLISIPVSQLHIDEHSLHSKPSLTHQGSSTFPHLNDELRGESIKLEKLQQSLNVKKKSVTLHTENDLQKSLTFQEANAILAWECTAPENGGEYAKMTKGALLLVDRRAPLNPLKSKVIRSPVTLSEIERRKLKGVDPAGKKIGIMGKLVVGISTTALLFFVFLFEHVLNYTLFGGMCTSQVLYPTYTLGIQPFLVDIGYGACEYNTGILAKDRCSVGGCSSFAGYPVAKVRNWNISKVNAASDGFNPRIYFPIGALDTNLIRNYGETFRVFWAMYLHAGWLHIFLNVSSQIQLFWMIEPDWGFLRTAVLFLISGISGNLLSAVADPCSVTVGSSGALYGLLGALIPYSIEYWKTIPRPGCVISMMLLIIFLGFLLGMSGITDNYAHMGGCLGGLLFGFATISNVNAFDKCTLFENILLSPVGSWALSGSTLAKLKIRKDKKKQEGQDKRLVELVKRKTATGKRQTIIKIIKKIFEKEGRPKCKMAKREWIVRGISVSCLILIWILLLLYLLVPSIYKTSVPPGNLRFSGYVPCYCCTIYDTGLSGVDLITKDIGLGEGRTYGVQGFYWCFSSKVASQKYCNPTNP